MIVVLLLFALAAAVVVCVAFACALARQQRRLERIGRRVASLELDANPPVVIEPAPGEAPPRLPTQLLN